MKNFSSSITRLVAVAACALTLGSCNRAEYAMLPKGSSYLGSTRVATPVPAAPAKEVAATEPTVAEALPATAALPAPVVAAAPAAAPAAPAAQPQVAATPAPTPAAAATVAAAPAPKLNLGQRMALSKVARQLNKLAQKPGMMQQHDNTAATKKLDTRLRQAILFWVLGVILEIVGAFTSGFIYVAGAVLIVIGTVFFIIWLVEKFSK